MNHGNMEHAAASDGVWCKRIRWKYVLACWKESLGKLFNGIALLMARPFRKGEWVKIDSEAAQLPPPTNGNR